MTAGQHVEPWSLPDRSLFCGTCNGQRPHRWRPSPEAGPFWRCSECGEPFSDTSGGESTLTASALLAEKDAEIAALKANSAALTAALIKSCTLCWGSGEYWPHCGLCGDSTNDHECPPKQPCHHPHLPPEAKAPNPGAVLLEKHREELAAAARRHETTRATMHVREEQHRKELVRERNRAREEAAQVVELSGAEMSNASKRRVAAAIRTKKEAE